MSTKYKWFRIGFSQAEIDFLSLASRHPFRPKSEYGFSQITGEATTSDYRFLWRSELTITNYGRNGLPKYERIQTVNFVDFSYIVRNGTSYLRLENPGRNVRNLLNALEAMLGFGFTAQLLAFDKHTPKTVFKGTDFVRLTSAKLVGAVVNQDVVARIEFASKEGMALDKLAILSGLNYKTDFASYELSYRGVRGNFSYSTAGVVKIGGQLAPRLLALLETDLLKGI